MAGEFQRSVAQVSLLVNQNRSGWIVSTWIQGAIGSTGRVYFHRRMTLHARLKGERISCGRQMSLSH